METTEEIVDLAARYQALRDDPRRPLVAFVETSLTYGRSLVEVDVSRAHQVLATALDTLHDPPAPSELEVATEILGLFELVSGRLGDVPGQLEALERQRRARRSAASTKQGSVELRRRSAAVLAADGRSGEALCEVVAGIDDAAIEESIEGFSQLIADMVVLLAAGGSTSSTVRQLESRLGAIRRAARTGDEATDDAWALWSLVGLAALRMMDDEPISARLYLRQVEAMADRMVLPALAGVVMAEVSLAERDPATSIAICADVIPLTSTDPRLHRLALAVAGRAHLDLGEIVAARALLESALAIPGVWADRTELSTRSLLAELYAGAGHFESAYEQLRCAVERSRPHDAEPSVDLRDSRVVPRSIGDSGPGVADAIPATPAPPEIPSAADGQIIELARRVTEQDRQLEQAMVDLRDLGERVELDALTGLIGRERLREILDVTLRRNGSVAVLSIDVDRFGRINETLGHGAGDTLLVEVSRRLRESLSVHDVIGRWGDDEFIVVVPGVSEPLAARSLAEGVRQLVSAPWMVDGREIVPSISVGVAVSRAETDADELLREADAALAAAKRRGKDRVELFDGELGHRGGRELDVESMLRQAITHGWFELFYQPIYSNGTSRPDAAEALLRLRHPDFGLIPPLDFLDVAEASGLGHVIGRWVIDTACTALARWSHTNPAFRMAVNVAPSMLDPELPRVVLAAARRHGAPLSALVIELTEHTLLEANDEQVAVLVALRELGVRIALDDFGTAYSSLHHLRRFPVDVVKIDRTFVAGIAEHANDVAIVRAIVDLSRVFGFRVIAEGVETAEQLDVQRRLGCFGAQGYLIGRPQAESEFAAMITGLDAVDLLMNTRS